MPIVRAVFPNPRNGKQIEVGCLIDSGADDIFLNTRLADALGVDLTKGMRKEYQGITSTPVVASEQFISMKIEPDLHQFNVACSFLPDLPVFGLLGQNGFFDSYKVVFTRYKGVFELTPVEGK
jgi:Aspartyl protease